MKLLKPFKLTSYLLILASLFISSSIYGQTWSQFSKVVPADRIAFANYGNAVAINGDYAFVGAPKDNSDALSQNPQDETGSVYVYKKVNGVWSFHQKLVASDRTDYDYFGWSVAISGNYAIVGSYFSKTDASGNNPLNGAGAAYIFKNNGTSWVEVQKIVASDRDMQDYFGFSVDIDDDNVVVGAYQNDYDASGANQQLKAGAAYIFQNNGTSWVEVQKIVALDRSIDDNFGKAVSISGKYIVVGAPQEDQDATNANYLSNAGSAYIFKENGGNWSQIKKIVASDRSVDANFGNAVDNSFDYILVGAFKETTDANGANSITEAGAAYFYENNSDAWDQLNKIVAGDRYDVAHFGRSVSLYNTTAVIGSEADCYNLTGHTPADSVNVAGSAFIFELQGSNWTQTQKIIANDRNEWANFGQSVAIFDKDILVGAYRDSKDANGANNLNFAGSAYFFGESCTVDTTITVVGIVSTGVTFSANQAGATYQWVDCDNANAPIAGETAQTFTATSNGNYAVIITYNGCTMTSNCKPVNELGISKLETTVFSISPNPTDGYFTIKSTNHDVVDVEVCSLLGTVVYKTTKSSGDAISINLSNQYAGVYLVKVNGKFVGKIVKR